LKKLHDGKMAHLYWEDDEPILPAQSPKHRSRPSADLDKEATDENKPQKGAGRNQRASPKIKITVSPRRGVGSPKAIGSPRESGQMVRDSERLSSPLPFDLPSSPMSADTSYSFALPAALARKTSESGGPNSPARQREARAFKKEIERQKRQSDYEATKAKNETKRKAALINRQRALGLPSSNSKNLGNQRHNLSGKQPKAGMLTAEDLEVGAVVVLKKRGLGIVRYIGPIHCDQEKSNMWLGVELKSPDGKNDGTVQDKKYFACKPKHGVFVRAVKRKIDPGELLAKIAKLKKENDQIAVLKKELRQTRRDFEEYKNEVENHEQRLLELCYPLLSRRGAGALVGQLQATGHVTSEITLSPMNPQAGSVSFRGSRRSSKNLGSYR